ncbi:MAG: ATP-dependent Clp protease adaptor ClpS [Lachnospiraceae bacterium]|nr:ATP-dependent Clp protease adaptor ClpS [Lachnospiraceae bacterium]
MPEHKRGRSANTSAAVKYKPKKPSLYKVIMLNDDVTTMDFVVDILVKIFDKPREKAVELMYKVHREGRAVIARYPYDIAATKRRQAVEKARAEGFPFNIDLESE